MTQQASKRQLTKRQQEVLAIIKQAMKEQGMPPTRAEISKQLGFKSPNAAEEHLKALAKKGEIEMLPGTSRGIRLPKSSGQRTKGLPVLGQIAAGSPLLAQENIASYLRVDPEAFKPKADYLLRVKGLSMTDIGILEGDLLAVHRTQKSPENGQLVIARLDNEVTVKRFRQEGSRVWLLPENDAFAPLEVDLTQDNLCIEGIAVGLIREDFVKGHA